MKAYQVGRKRTEATHPYQQSQTEHPKQPKSGGDAPQ